MQSQFESYVLYIYVSDCIIFYCICTDLIDLRQTSSFDSVILLFLIHFFPHINLHDCSVFPARNGTKSYLLVVFSSSKAFHFLMHKNKNTPTIVFFIHVLIFRKYWQNTATFKGVEFKLNEGQFGCLFFRMLEVRGKRTLNSRNIIRKIYSEKSETPSV